jgi:hypothetical protein
MAPGRLKMRRIGLFPDIGVFAHGARQAKSSGFGFFGSASLNKALNNPRRQKVETFLRQFPYLCRLNLGILALLSKAQSLKLLVFNKFSTVRKSG